MYIKGIPDYNKNGEARETGLFAGLVSQDGELRTTGNGKHYGCASVRAFNRKDGSAVFMTIKSFSETLAPLISELCKGDRILAAGVVETREYNGKNYTDMLVDFLMTDPMEAFTPATAATTAQNFADLSTRMKDAGFAEIGEEDGELPF